MDDKRDRVEITIQQYLDKILNGEVSLESISALHPEFEKILRQELEAALWLINHQKQLDPRPGFIMASRRRLVSRIRQARSPFWLALRSIPRLGVSPLALRGALAVLALMAILIGSFFSVAAQSALPGEPLYPMKTFLEEARLSVAFHPLSQARIRVELAQRRANEAQALILQGHPEVATDVLGEFEYQAREAILLLEALKEQDPAETQKLAGKLHLLLQDQTQVIGMLSAVAPPGAELEQAVSRSQEQVTALQNTLFDLGVLTTPTPIASVTDVVVNASPTVQSSLTASSGREAAVATATPRPTRTPRPSNTHRPTELSKTTPTPTLTARNTRKPTSTPKPTNTPRPTNTHRPPKPSSERPTKTPKP